MWLTACISNYKMRSTALILGLLATSSAFAGNFAIQTAYPSDPAGNALTPNLGEPFWMTVRYQVGQAQSGSMRVSTPWTGLSSSVFTSQAGTQQATYGPLVPLFDGTIPIRVQVGDASADVSVTPAAPQVSIEYFNPRSWQADFGASIQFKPGAPTKVDWYVPKAPSLGFQSIFTTRLFEGTLVAQDVFKQININQTGSAFQSTSSSVRVGANALRKVKFDTLKILPASVKLFLKSETLIESGDKNVKTLVSNTLGKNFQKTMPVYDAAQSLYRAVINRIQYVDATNGRPSAAQALKTGYGDCGFFASAFSAACRNAGIPARPITGFLAGPDEWHVWAEFYVPGHGWIPVDPSYADGKDPQGNYALYFGVIPDLNQRVATAIGFDHSFARVKIPMLQSPYAITDVKKVLSASAWCNLVEIAPLENVPSTGENLLSRRR